MQTNALTDKEYQATFGHRMIDITGKEDSVYQSGVPDFWPYVNSIPGHELQGCAIYDQFVEQVYRTDDNQFDHVLVMTKKKNVYLVVVVDIQNDAVLGHHLLDLNEKYGI